MTSTSFNYKTRTFLHEAEKPKFWNYAIVLGDKVHRQYRMSKRVRAI